MNKVVYLQIGGARSRDALVANQRPRRRHRWRQTDRASWRWWKRPAIGRCSAEPSGYCRWDGTVAWRQAPANTLRTTNTTVSAFMTAETICRAVSGWNLLPQSFIDSFNIKNNNSSNNNNNVICKHRGLSATAELLVPVAVAERPRDASCHWILCYVTESHSRSLEMIPLSTT